MPEQGHLACSGGLRWTRVDPSILLKAAPGSITYPEERSISPFGPTRHLRTTGLRQPIRRKPQTRREEPTRCYGWRSRQRRNKGPMLAYSCASPGGSGQSITGICGSTPRRAVQSGVSGRRWRARPPSIGHRASSSQGPSCPAPVRASVLNARTRTTDGTDGTARMVASPHGRPSGKLTRKTPDARTNGKDQQSGLCGLEPPTSSASGVAV